MLFIQPFVLLFFYLALAPAFSCQPKTNPVRPAADTTVQNILLVDSLPSPSGYVNDYEEIYTGSEEKTLDSLLKDFEKNTTIRIVVITIDSTMTTKDGVDALTKRFANEWEVGHKENNGVTVGISKAYRRMRIENGSGIQKILTDNETKEIIDKVFIPDFRKGKYFEGTHNGLKTLISILEKRTK